MVMNSHNVTTLKTSGTAAAQGFLSQIVEAVTTAATLEASLCAVVNMLEPAYGVRAASLTVTHPLRQQIVCGDAQLLDASDRQPHDVAITQIAVGAGTVTEASLLIAAPPEVTLPLDELHAITAILGYSATLRSLNTRAEKADALTRKRISEMAAVYELGREVAPTDTDKLLKDITTRTAVLMEAAVCSVLLVDKQSGHLLLAANYGLPDDVPQQLQKVSEGVAGVVTQTREPILIDPACPDSRLSHIDISSDKGPAIVVPMKDQAGEVIGVLAIRRGTPGATFSHEDMQLISVFAAQAALAILNARLYEDLERRAQELETLSTLSRALIQNTDLDRLLENVVEEVCRTAGFRRCGVLMLDIARPVYMPRKWAGYGQGFYRLRARGGDGPLGLVASSGISHLFSCRSDAANRFDPKLNLRIRGLARALGVDTFCVAPILDTEAKCVGLIVADNRSSPQPITAAQFSLLSGFAGQVGVAVENSRLYYEMQDALETTKRVRLYTDKVLHSVGVAILSTDSEGKIIRWNPAAEQTLKLTGGMFHEATLETLVNRLDIWPEEKAQVLGKLAEVRRSGVGLPRTRLTVHTSGGEVNIALFVTPLPATPFETPGLVIIVEDLTQETRLQAELEKMQRLADIGQFAARMAHETRNALSPMRAAAQLMKRDLEAVHANTDWPDIIIDEVDSLNRLTGEILDFARPGTLDLQKVDINDLLQSSIAKLSELFLNSQIALDWQLSEDTPHLLADESQIDQVIRNLVMNAAQAMPHGGKLTVLTGFDERSMCVYFAIQDEGHGIASTDTERIFKPFVTTRTKGTGLGLPIVQKVIDQHGGRIILDSRPNVGTTFRILLPLEPMHDRGIRLGPQHRVSVGNEEGLPDR